MDSSKGQLAVKTELENCEVVIDQGLATFVEVGQALAKIRDGKLYQESHDTFADYLNDRWEFKTSHAYRLITASEVAVTLSPIGGQRPTERVARELANAPEGDRPAIWAKLSKQGRVTAAAVKAFLNPEASTEPEQEEPQEEEHGYVDDFDDEPEDDAVVICLVDSQYQAALTSLSRIRKDIKTLHEDARYGGYLRTCATRIMNEIDTVKASIRQVLPKEICGDCEGIGCKDCEETGFLTHAVVAARKRRAKSGV